MEKDKSASELGMRIVPVEEMSLATFCDPQGLFYINLVAEIDDKKTKIILAQSSAETMEEAYAGIRRCIGSINNVIISNVKKYSSHIGEVETELTKVMGQPDKAVVDRMDLPVVIAVDGMPDLRPTKSGGTVQEVMLSASQIPGEPSDSFTMSIVIMDDSEHAVNISVGSSLTFEGAWDSAKNSWNQLRDAIDRGFQLSAAESDVLKMEIEDMRKETGSVGITMRTLGISRVDFGKEI